MEGMALETLQLYAKKQALVCYGRAKTAAGDNTCAWLTRQGLRWDHLSRRRTSEMPTTAETPST